MRSNREQVVLLGTAEGMGRVIEAMISAIRVSLPNSSEYTYIRPIPHNMPTDAPDGRYIIKLDGREFPAEWRNGSWVASFAP